jgi:4-hydroxyphenylpyruvate dioxygenase-like putative hemolysin
MLWFLSNLIELLEPTDAKSVLHRFLQRKGEGLYHISLVTDNLEGEANTLRAKGVHVV